MDQSLKIQMDIKNNAQDLQNFALDLKNWEKEMKKKEEELARQNPINRDLPLPRNKIKRNNPINEKNIAKSKTQKISGYDYSAWDRYDVDKACAELDDENECPDVVNEENTLNQMNNKEGNDKSDDDGSSGDDDDDDEDKLSLIDKAYCEKEMGNQYVKKEEWDSAIKCYTRAIKFDPKNAIYYANRSLCFLKLKNFRSAEVDATTALQLDKNYVKAYQRRGFARLELKQFAEAKSDFEEVLRIEPKNSLMRLELNKINEKLKKESKIAKPKSIFSHKNMFKPEVKDVQHKNKVATVKTLEKTKTVKIQNTTAKPIIESSKENMKDDHMSKGDKITVGEEGDHKSKEKSIFKDLPENCEIVHPVHIPPHKRSKKPLKKIEITMEDEEEWEKTVFANNVELSVELRSKSTRDSKTSENKYEPDFSDVQKASSEVPRTSVQFQYCWKYIKKTPEEAYKYLKKVAAKLPQIFENSLESDLFSDLLAFLAVDQPNKELAVVYSILLNLSNVKRFNSMTLFMSKSDKANVEKCISELKQIKSESEISELIKLYELHSSS